MACRKFRQGDRRLLAPCSWPHGVGTLLSEACDLRPARALHHFHGEPRPQTLLLPLGPVTVNNEEVFGHTTSQQLGLTRPFSIGAPAPFGQRYRGASGARSCQLAASVVHPCAGARNWHRKAVDNVFCEAAQSAGVRLQKGKGASFSPDWTLMNFHLGSSDPSVMQLSMLQTTHFANNQSRRARPGKRQPKRQTPTDCGPSLESIQR